MSSTNRSLRRALVIVVVSIAAGITWQPDAVLVAAAPQGAQTAPPAKTDTVKAVPAQSDPQHLEYQIPKEVLAVDAKKTTTVTRKITVAEAAKKGDPGKVIKFLEVVADTKVAYEGEAALRLVGDRSLTVPLDLPARPLMDNKAVFELRDGTLLKSINVSSTGKLGTVLNLIAKFAGSVLGTAIKGAAIPKGLPEVALNDCHVMEAPLVDLPMTVRLFLQENDRGCRLFGEIEAKNKMVEGLIKARADAEEGLKAALDPAALKVLLDRIKGLQAAVAAGQKEGAAKQTEFGELMADFLATQKLGASTEIEEYHRVLELTDLPPDGLIEGGMSNGDVAKALTTGEVKYPAALALFNAAHVVVTLGDLRKPDVIPAVPASVSTSKDLQICFRQGTPLRLRLFTTVVETNDGVDVEKLKQVTDRYETVVHPWLLVSCMTFKASVLADRSLVFTFDDKGRPSRVERSSTSDAAALASALASSATSLRDEYAATLSKMVEVQTSKRSLALNDLTTKLETLKKQKEVLDAQLSLDAATASTTTVLQQKQAESQMSALQAQINLETLQATADQQQQLAGLKVTVDLLMKEIDLLKAKVDYEKLKKQ